MLLRQILGSLPDVHLERDLLTVSTPAAVDPRERFARKVAATLHAAGFQGLFAGGCVRDRLMGRCPKDYDVATNATPEQVREVFGTNRTLAIGASFGVIAVVGRRSQDEGQVDVATFRTDVQYSDGRRPDAVRYSKSAEEDAQRRDFTINGLYYDPSAERLLDFVGGQADLSARLVRAIGDPYQRFTEDRLRMLRAVRFASTFAFELEPQTRAAIIDQAAELSVVSPERIGMELRRMFNEPHAEHGLRMIQETNLLLTIFPPLATRWLQPAPDPLSQGISLDLPCGQLAVQLIENLPRHSLASVTACLVLASQTNDSLGDQGLAELHRLIDVAASRWRLSNDEQHAIKYAAAHAPRLLDAAKLPWSATQPVLIQPAIDEALSVAAALATVLKVDPSGLYFCRERLAWPEERLNPAPLVSGDDLKRLGIPPGPRYRELLEAVRRLQLDGQLQTAVEAHDWLKPHAADRD
jgi:poly(A) polymerase